MGFPINLPLYTNYETGKVSYTSSKNESDHKPCPLYYSSRKGTAVLYPNVVFEDLIVYVIEARAYSNPFIKALEEVLKTILDAELRRCLPPSGSENLRNKAIKKLKSTSFEAILANQEGMTIRRFHECLKLPSQNLNSSEPSEDTSPSAAAAAAVI